MSMEDHIRELGEEWMRQLSSAVESMTGETPAATWQHAPPSPEGTAEEQSLWWLQPLSLDPDASLAVGTPEATWLSIGTRSLRMAGIDEVERNDARGTYLEILQQALSGFSRSLSDLVGHEVTCEKGREITAVPEGAETSEVTLSIASETLPPVTVGLSLALLKAVSASKQPQEDTALSVSRAVSENAEGAVAATVPSKTLDLLLDVELPVSVSFGRAKLPLKDVIKLTTGSIVELNRTVTEPVEIIVNNCVIARGEVVVIEGNYGVRINQIISRQERLRTLN
jgi:flagellar motor switch protein FliN/FliY